MDDPSGDGITLVRFKRDRLIFKINEKLTLEDKKELVFLIVFMPVKFSLYDAEANHAVIHLTQGLVIPLLLTGGDKAGDINCLLTEQEFRRSKIRIFLYFVVPRSSEYIS